MNINYFMNEALIEAEKAYNLNEIPIGAVLVDNKSNEIISKNLIKLINLITRSSIVNSV